MRRSARLVLLGMFLFVTTAAADALNVYFIDVGAGDAILIDYGEWEALLDAGRGYSAQEAELLRVLAEHVDDGVIELGILSHPHADHFGGFADVFAQYEVREFWRSIDTVPDNAGSTYVRFLSALSSEGLSPHLVELGDSYQTGAITLSVLGPTRLKSGTPDDNDNSLVLLLTHGTVHYLLVGDIETYGESGVRTTPLPCGRLILKIAHHGSDTSTHTPFLDWAQPDLTVISTGYVTPPVLTLLESKGIPSLMTSRSGTIRVSTDGVSYECDPPCEEDEVSTVSQPAPPETGTSPFSGTSAIITEVEINPPGSDSGAEWIEIQNPTDQAISLTGWAASYTGYGGGWDGIPAVTLAPGEYYRFVYPKQHLENSRGEVIRLRNAAGVVVDETIEGLVDEVSGGGDSWTWQRFPDGPDPDSLDDWVFKIGTPGSAN